LPAQSANIDVTPPMVSAQVADPDEEDYRRADAIVAGLPGQLRAMASLREGAMPLLLGLLLAPDEEVADLQRSEIVARLGVGVAAGPRRLPGGPLAPRLPRLRLPRASLASPTLPLRPRRELATFLDTVHAVVHAAGGVSLFEYCLGRLLEVQL